MSELVAALAVGLLLGGALDHWGFPIMNALMSRVERWLRQSVR
jgi:hypothetical protein